MLKWSQDSSFRRSKTFEDNELEEEAGFLGGVAKRSGSTSWRPSLLNRCWTVFNIILFSALMVMLLSNQNIGRNVLLKKTSFYSPLLDRFDISTRVQKMDADFFPSSHPSVGRQEPNPDADAVWDEWEVARTFIVTGDELRKMGKDPSVVAKADDKIWHLGDDAYMTTFDVFHQLHCLNSLRKLIYPDYYNYTNSHMKHPELWYHHLNHCVDILMQNIQCTGSTDLVPMAWVETQSIPFPDFNINHQCRDFDALVEWRKENTLDIGKYIEFLKKPPGVKQLPQQEKYFEIYGEQDREGSISLPPV